MLEAKKTSFQVQDYVTGRILFNVNYYHHNDSRGFRGRVPFIPVGAEQVVTASSVSSSPSNYVATEWTIGAPHMEVKVKGDGSVG